MGLHFKPSVGRSEIYDCNPTPNLILRVLWWFRQADKSVFLLSFLIVCQVSGKLEVGDCHEPYRILSGGCTVSL